MASPFSKFQGNTGPTPDVYNAYKDAQNPIADGIMTLAKGIGSYMSEQRKAEEDEKDRKAKSETEAAKMGFEREKFEFEKAKTAAELGKGREASDWDRQKWFLEQGRKDRDTKIKGLEGKYDRLKSRVGDIDTVISGYRGSYGDNIPPQVQAKIDALEAQKGEIIGELGGIGKDIEANYEGNHNLDIYLGNREFQEGAQAEIQGIRERWGIPDQHNAPVENPPTPGSQPQPGAPTPPQQGTPAAPSQGAGMEVSAGSMPKFPSSPDGNAWSSSSYAFGHGNEFSVGNGGLVQQSPRTGALTGSPIELQPIGSNPVLTDIGSSWSNSFAYEDATPQPGNAGGRIVYTTGPNGTPVFKLAVSPTASDAQKANLERLGSITAFANTMDDSQAAELSALLRNDRGRAATDLFKALREKGMLPPEMDLIKFKAASAISLYRDGGSSALEGITDTQARLVGQISARNNNAPIQQPTPVVTPATTASTASAPRINYTGLSADPGSFSTNREFDSGRVQRLMQGGLIPNSPQMKAQFELFKAMDAAGLAKQRIVLSQANATAALAQAEAAMASRNSEGAIRSGTYESLLPGIGNTVGGKDVGFYSRVLGEPEGVDLSSRWREIRDKSDNITAWNQIIGSYGYNEKMEISRYESAVESSTSFERGFGGAVVINKLFESQIGKNWGENTYERLIGSQPAVAAQYRLFLLGAFRKATVGLGNPSNFEQELLLNLIPDPTSVFQITEKSVAKSKMLVLMTLANHMTDMDAAKFKMTDGTAEYYSTKLREAGLLEAGKSIKKEDFARFRSILRRNAGNPEDSISELRSWALDSGSVALARTVLNGVKEGEFKTSANNAETQERLRNLQRYLNPQPSSPTQGTNR